MTFDYPVLLGDIGGTNARFAVQVAPGAPPVALPIVPTGAFAAPTMAIREALHAYPAEPPRSANLAVAARVDGPSVHLTNAGWQIDAREIGEDLGLSRVDLVNDFVPVAVALSELGRQSGDLMRIGPDLAGSGGVRLVLGPGTGLGAAALVPVEDRFLVLPTEAGHVELGPADDLEAALWPALERVGGRVTAEAVLSGPGIRRLYRAVARARGVAPSLSTPGEITASGLTGTDPTAAETVDLFARLLGRFAGDLALIFAASGGVYLAGGILPQMVSLLDGGGLRSAFESKAPFDAVMRAIPTWIVTHPAPALLGLGLLAADGPRFIVGRHGWTRPG